MIVFMGKWMDLWFLCVLFLGLTASGKDDDLEIIIHEEYYIDTPTEVRYIQTLIHRTKLPSLPSLLLLLLLLLQYLILRLPS